jgi:FkbM family methyltransferase
MGEVGIAVLSGLLRAIPDRMPGKTRLGRMLLRPFLSRSPGVLTDRAGYTYSVPSYAESIAQHIFTFGAYERDTHEVILKFLPEWGTFIDVGASIGALAIPIAKARPHASVICLEADPNIHELLVENVIRNECDRIQSICCVVGPEDGQLAPFYRAPSDRFGMGSIGPQFENHPIMLAQRSLDALVADLNVADIDVVKIDVEGAELGVLRGARGILASERPPVIVFEFADWAEGRISGQQIGDGQSLLLASEYRLFRLEPGARIGAEVVTPLRIGSCMLLAVPPHASIPSDEASSRLLKRPVVIALAENGH